MLLPHSHNPCSGQRRKLDGFDAACLWQIYSVCCLSTFIFQGTVCSTFFLEIKMKMGGFYRISGFSSLITWNPPALLLFTHSFLAAPVLCIQFTFYCLLSLILSLVWKDKAGYLFGSKLFIVFPLCCGKYFDIFNDFCISLWFCEVSLSLVLQRKQRVMGIVPQGPGSPTEWFSSACASIHCAREWPACLWSRACTLHSVHVPALLPCP